MNKVACVFVAAMSIAANAAESNNVLAYLETLRTPDGLYGWAGDDEGRLAATHAAVMTYKTLGANPPGDLKKLAASARGLNPCAGGGATARAQRHAALLHRIDVELAETVKALGGDTGNWRRYAETSPHHSKIDDYMRGYEAGGNAELSLEMQKLRLREVTGAALTDDTRAVFTAYLDSRERPDGSYATTPAKDGSGGHVVQTFWALYGRAFMGERLNPAAADWIDACRLPDGSFTWTSDAAQESRIGDMEYVRAAVKALALFGRRPKNEAALVKWIAARRNRDGGFGDRPGARSNPLATWAAVDALAALGKLDVALRSPPKTDSVKRVLPRNTAKLKIWTIQFEAPGTGSVRDTVEFARDAKIHLWGAKNSPDGWIDAAQRLADAEGVRVTFFPSDESYGARRVVPGLGSFSHVDDPVTPPHGATEPRQFNLWQICDHESAARILLDSGRYEAVGSFHFWCYDMTWLLSFERRYENDLVFVSNQDSHTETWWWQDMLYSYRTVFLAEEPTWDAFRDACRRRLVASVRQDSHTRGRLYIIASAPEVREHLLKRKAEWWPEPRDHSSDVSLRILSPGDTFETGRPEKGRRLRVRTFRKWLGDKFLQPAACRLEKVVCNGSELKIERFEKRLERNDYMNGNLEEAYDTAELPASGPLDIRAHFGPAEGSGLKPFTRRLKVD